MGKDKAARLRKYSAAVMAVGTGIWIFCILVFIFGTGVTLSVVAIPAILTPPLFLASAVMAAQSLKHKRSKSGQWLTGSSPGLLLLSIMPWIILLVFMLGSINKTHHPDAPIMPQDMHITISFSSYTVHETQAMRGYRMRHGKVLDSCRFVNVRLSADDTCIAYGDLEFFDSDTPVSLLEDDTIFFRTPFNTHMICQIGWREVMGGKQPMSIKEHKVLNAG